MGFQKPINFTLILRYTKYFDLNEKEESLNWSSWTNGLVIVKLSRLNENNLYFKKQPIYVYMCYVVARIIEF